MKPKWGGISKYMGLDKLLSLKLHVYILVRLPFASAASHCWTLYFTMAVSETTGMALFYSKLRKVEIFNG